MRSFYSVPSSRPSSTSLGPYLHRQGVGRQSFGSECTGKYMHMSTSIGVWVTCTVSGGRVSRVLFVRQALPVKRDGWHVSPCSCWAHAVHSSLPTYLSPSLSLSLSLLLPRRSSSIDRSPSPGSGPPALAQPMGTPVSPAGHSKRGVIRISTWIVLDPYSVPWVVKRSELACTKPLTLVEVLES